MFGGVSSKLFEQETVSCSALENESMETTNNDKLGKQKMFPSRKFNLWVKEAPARAGRRAEEYLQTGRELLEPEHQHRAGRLKPTMPEARTKIPLISQCKETRLYLPDKGDVKATRAARAVCCDSDPPPPQLPGRTRLATGTSGGSSRAAPVPASAPRPPVTQPEDKRRVHRSRLRGVLRGVARREVTKRDPAEVEAQREVSRHEPRRSRHCHRQRQGSFLMHGGQKRYRKVKSTGRVEPFARCSAVRRQWKLMGLSSR